jgi:S-DNA-T family DNA segregation ATPase FtsK/SpoIIIE
VRDAVPAEPAPEEVPEREAAQSDPDAPFTEITVLDDAPAAEPEGVVVTVEANEAKLLDERAIPTESYDPLKDLVNYRKPPVTLLEDYISDSEVSDEEIFENKTKIEDTLKNFGIPIQRIKATVGPTVTLYEIVQAQGIKISKVQGLENDIAQSLKALGIRIIAPIPGKGTIGIEVPNRDKQVVSMYSAVRSLRFQESKAELPVVIGRTIQNENYVFDLAKMPHLLVAGATGQGKSVGLNAIITSLLYRKHPAQLKFVMIDPKMVEFSLYAKIERHFLAKMESEDDAIITDPKKAVYTLNSLCTEMDNRLELCKKAGARNIAEYNEKFTSRRLNPMNGHRYLPYIVVVVDEFADLIMTAREVEGPVMRLAQKARAIGIHLIIATQRPDVKVITGGIKANFPARIAFRVMQMIDSRTIIDQPGANQLIGRGDMLFSKDGDLTRIQCALVETREVERICEYISKQQGYTAAYALPDYTPDGDGTQMGSEESSAPVKYDSLFAEIARDAVSGGQISTSMIQRNYEVGFNRAGRIMMQLERAGIVGRQQGAKPRDILYHDLPSLEAKLQELGLF